MTLMVIVLVKAVPDEQLERRINGDTLRLDRNASVISELDEYAVEAALRMRESTESVSEVVAVTMGPAVAASAVRKALQLGADSAVHIQDDSFVASDALITSKVLAAAIKKIMAGDEAENYLVIAGMASPDGSTGLVPAQVASRLGIPLLSHCSEMLFDGKTCLVKGVQHSRGYVRELTARLPAVVSVTEQMPSPRYPNFRSILAAKEKKIEVWQAEALGLSAGDVGAHASQTEVECVERHQPRTSGVLIDATDYGVEETAVRVVDFLIERGILSRKQKK